jgi:hypothetical protein
LNLFGGDETPYESLHAVVSNGVKPWFEAFVGARHGGKDGDSKMGEWPCSDIIFLVQRMEASSSTPRGFHPELKAQ